MTSSFLSLWLRKDASTSKASPSKSGKGRSVQQTGPKRPVEVEVASSTSDADSRDDVDERPVKRTRAKK